jgi:aminopeptidase N
MYISYSRAGVAFYVLKDILGAELFQKTLKSFINRWAGKHPTAYDFIFTFEDISDQDLGWFWQPWFFDFGYPYLTIQSPSREAGELKVVIEKLGSFPAPVKLVVSFNDGTFEEFNKSAGIWADGQALKTLTFKIDKSVKKVEIDAVVVPDNNKSNNSFTLD